MMVDPIQSSWWLLAYDTWPWGRVEAFDRVVDEFETAWQEGKSSQIDPILRTVPEEERPVWLMELVAVELIARWGHGDAFSIVEFQKRFPDDTALIQCVWTEISPNMETLLAKKPGLIEPALIQEGGSAFQPGQVLDNRFRIEKFIKQGGMAELYRAQLISDNSSVAIKAFTPSPGNLRHGARLEERFVRENELLRQLRHPHLLTAFELLRIPGQPLAIVMDWVDGRDLAEEVALHGPMAWPEAALAISQIGEGLGWAWRKFKLVHRDIKPLNLMLKRDGDIVVLDFGLARITHVSDVLARRELTSQGDAFGTPDFISPEQSDNSRDVGATADVYSIGCTLFYLLTGVAPFAFGEAAQLPRQEAHRRLPPPDVRTLCPSVPVEIARLIQQMLAKIPLERPADGSVVADALKPWTTHADLRRRFEGHSPNPPKPVKQSIKSTFSHQIWSLRTACFLLLAVIGGMLVFNASDGTSPSPVDFQVSLYRGNAANALPERVGEIGRTSFAAQSGNLSQLRVRFGTPVYIQLYAIDGSGKSELLVGSAADSPAPKNVISGPTDTLIFPVEGYWQLEEVGLSAFVLLANQKPLPPTEKLMAVIDSSIDWARTHSISGVWKSEGRSIQPLFAMNEHPRDRLVQIAPAPLKLLRESIQKATDDNTRVELIAFPVVD